MFGGREKSLLFPSARNPLLNGDCQKFLHTRSTPCQQKTRSTPSSHHLPDYHRKWLFGVAQHALIGFLQLQQPGFRPREGTDNQVLNGTFSHKKVNRWAVEISSA
jgi:hypothetical protein